MKISKIFINLISLKNLSLFKAARRNIPLITDILVTDLIQKKIEPMEKALLDKFSGKGALPETLVIDHVSAATRLLEKRRQMFEVQEALNSQKEEFTRREDAFRRREEALRRKDLELQESLIKFNKFLQENEVDTLPFCIFFRRQF